MSTYVHKSHNVTVLLYHLVFPAKYRRAVIDGSVDRALRDVCLEIEARYTIGAYVKQQGANYQQLHQDRQLALF